MAGDDRATFETFDSNPKKEDRLSKRKYYFIYYSIDFNLPEIDE